MIIFAQKNQAFGQISPIILMLCHEAFEIIYAHALKKSPRAGDKYLGLAAGNSDYHTNILTDRSLR